MRFKIKIILILNLSLVALALMAYPNKILMAPAALIVSPLYFWLAALAKNIWSRNELGDSGWWLIFIFFPPALYFYVSKKLWIDRE